MPMVTNRISSGGVVFRPAGAMHEVALIRVSRSDGQAWALPKGWVEKGEDLEQTAVREVREELNIEIKVQELFETICYEYPEKHVTLKFFRCSYLEGRTRALECLQFLWVSPGQLMRYQFPPADAPIVKRIMNSEF